MLKLADGIPLVWRTPTSVQFGIEPRLVVLEGVDAGLERLLAAIEGGLSRTGFDMMARQAGRDPEELFEALRPALARELAPSRVLVVGSGPVAEELRQQLGSADEPDLVMLVADWVVAPEDHGMWLRRDIPHLPVVIGDGSVTVGPLVVPGAGPCLYCVHLHRTDADPAWPAIATQLWGRPAPRLPRTAVAEAAAFAARRVRNAVPGTAWRLDVRDGTVSERDWSRHPSCLCAAPQESDWVPAADRAAPPATSSATAAAVPA